MHRFSIAGIVKDEAKTIPWFLDKIAFLKNYGLAEIVWLDTGSTDGTPEVVKSFQGKYCVPIHLFHQPFEDYGTSRTRALRLASVGIPWIFVIDPDEHVLEAECKQLQEMLSDPTELWYVPRKKWGDLKMTDQREANTYPDWQCRLVRNKPHVHYSGKVHEMLWAKQSKWHTGSFCIHHFEPVFRGNVRLWNKYARYRDLGKQKRGHSRPVPTSAEVIDPNVGIRDFKWHHELAKYFVPGMTLNGYPDYNWEYDFILRHMPPGKHRIIDAGGGVGVMQVHLAKCGHEVHNVDQDPQILKKIRAINQRFGTDIKAYHAALTDIPGSNGNADVIISCSSLEHNKPETLTKIMSELVRKLRPGGALIYTLPLAATNTSKWDPRVFPLWRWDAKSLRKVVAHPALTDMPHFKINQGYALNLAKAYPGTRFLYPIGISVTKR